MVVHACASILHATHTPVDEVVLRTGCAGWPDVDAWQVVAIQLVARGVRGGNGAIDTAIAVQELVCVVGLRRAHVLVQNCLCANVDVALGRQIGRAVYVQSCVCRCCILGQRRALRAVNVARLTVNPHLNRPAIRILRGNGGIGTFTNTGDINVDLILA